MTDTTYQGYANYETWAVSLHLRNEYDSYKWLVETAGRISDDNELAEAIKNMVELSIPEMSGLAYDLMRSAFDNVVWIEIAREAREMS